MAAEQQYSPLGAILNENVCERARADDDPLIQQYLSASCEFAADLNTEAEVNYYLRDAAEVLRPSIIFGLARIAADQRHFAKLIQSALLAAASLEHAEWVAGEATEGFSHDQAHRADAAWLLVLLAAGQAAAPDPEWTEALSVNRRVHAALGARPRDLLEQMLSDAGTRAVWPEDMDDMGDGE